MHQLITLLVIFIILWLVIIIFNSSYCGYGNPKNKCGKKCVTNFNVYLFFSLWVLFVLFYASLVLFFAKPCRMGGPVILMILIVSVVTVQIIEMLWFSGTYNNISCVSKCATKKHGKKCKKSKKCSK